MVFAAGLAAKYQDSSKSERRQASGCHALTACTNLALHLLLQRPLEAWHRVLKLHDLLGKNPLLMSHPGVIMESQMAGCFGAVFQTAESFG